MNAQTINNSVSKLKNDLHPIAPKNLRALRALRGEKLTGVNVRKVQELLGHAKVTTTEIYTHVVKKGPLGVTSPADRITLMKPEEPSHEEQPGEDQSEKELLVPKAGRLTQLWQWIQALAACLVVYLHSPGQKP